MTYKKYKKKELLQIINELTNEIEEMHIELKNKDDKIFQLLREYDEKSMPIKEDIEYNKREKRLIDYLKKRIKVVHDKQKKNIYKNYLEKIINN
jgi:hypothetical protein